MVTVENSWFISTHNILGSVIMFHPSVLSLYSGVYKQMELRLSVYTNSIPTRYLTGLQQVGLEKMSQ